MHVFSGSLFNLSRAVPAAISYNTSKPVRQFITSGSAEEDVPDRSLFREYFVKAITSGDADANNDGYLTGSELGNYLFDKVTNYSYDQQHPQSGKIRDQYLDKGDFVFLLDSRHMETIQTTSVSITEEKLTRYGSIELTTEISGSLYLDGTYLKNINKNTIVTLNDIPTGTHKIKITGDNNWSKSINITKGNTTNITAEKPASILPTESYASKSGTFTDSRNGQRYKWVRIGDQTWMAENLNYETENSWCYDNNKANCETYGRLYNWDAAKKACPSGWHLPGDDEWTVLTDYLGGDEIAGNKLKSTSGWKKNGNGNNESGFSSLPGGYRSNSGTFGSLGSNGYWWYSTQYSSTGAWSRDMNYDGGYVNRGYYGKAYGFSVRCVRD